MKLTPHRPRVVSVPDKRGLAGRAIANPVMVPGAMYEREHDARLEGSGWATGRCEFDWRKP